MTIIEKFFKDLLREDYILKNTVTSSKNSGYSPRAFIFNADDNSFYVRKDNKTVKITPNGEEILL